MDYNKKFKESFNAIEKHLKVMMKADNHLSFYQLVNETAKINSIVKNYELELKSLGDIRNFIVHDDLRNPSLLVTEKTLNQIERIEQAIISPKRIQDIFESNFVYINYDHYLTQILSLINKTGYSQFPVFEKEQFQGLFTNKMLTLWLAKHIEDFNITLKDVKVSDVISSIKPDQRYATLSKTDNIYDLINVYRENEFESKIVLIILDDSKKGLTKNNIFRIMTISDLAQLFT